MDLTPLRRHRDYRLLYASQFVSFLGSMVTYVALPYQMYTLTHSSLAVGLLGLAELGPLLLTAFVGGALADAVDRRRLVIATDVGLAVGQRLARHHGEPRGSARVVPVRHRRPHVGAQRPPEAVARGPHARASWTRTSCRRRPRSACSGAAWG